MLTSPDLILCASPLMMHPGKNSVSVLPIYLMFLPSESLKIKDSACFCFLGLVRYLLKLIVESWFRLTQIRIDVKRIPKSPSSFNSGNSDDTEVGSFNEVKFIYLRPKVGSFLLIIYISMYRLPSFYLGYSPEWYFGRVSFLFCFFISIWGEASRQVIH